MGREGESIPAVCNWRADALLPFDDDARRGRHVADPALVPVGFLTETHPLYCELIGAARAT